MDELNDIVLAGISTDVANLQLPDPNLRQHYLDEQDRIYWVDSAIDESTLDLVKFIIRCNRDDKGKPIEERKPIKIMIDSPGGSIEILWTLINTIKISKTPCYTISYCTAYSAAGVLLASGHKRFALPGTSVLLHNGSCLYTGQADQVASTKKFFDNMGKSIVDYLLTRTKIDPKVYKKRAVTDWFMTEVEALEQGIIDKIVEDLDELL